MLPSHEHPEDGIEQAEQSESDTQQGEHEQRIDRIVDRLTVDLDSLRSELAEIDREVEMPVYKGEPEKLREVETSVKQARDDVNEVLSQLARGGG